MKLVLVFGLIFQMPTLVLFLARMGVITARFLIRNMKYAILIMFIVGAVLSPGTDPCRPGADGGADDHPVLHQHRAGVDVRQEASEDGDRSRSGGDRTTWPERSHAPVKWIG